MNYDLRDLSPTSASKPARRIKIADAERQRFANVYPSRHELFVMAPEVEHARFLNEFEG
jgi:hypothetical protein